MITVNYLICIARLPAMFTIIQCNNFVNKNGAAVKSETMKTSRFLFLFTDVAIYK